MADVEVTSDGEERVATPEKTKDTNEKSYLRPPKAAADYLSMLGAHHEARLAAVDTATAAAAAAAAVLAWCPALMPPWCQLVPAWCRPSPIMHHSLTHRKNKNTSSTGSVLIQDFILM
jgi:hypothetical protein